MGQIGSRASERGASGAAVAAAWGERSTLAERGCGGLARSERGAHPGGGGAGRDGGVPLSGGRIRGAALFAGSALWIMGSS